MTGSSAVELQLGLSQDNLKIVSRPFLVRNDQVLAGVVFDPIISINVRDDGGAFIFPNLCIEWFKAFSQNSPPHLLLLRPLLLLTYLASFGVIIVVVAVEEISYGKGGELSNLCQHGFGVFNIHGVNDHDSVCGDDEHGDPGSIEREGVDTFLYTATGWTLEPRSLLLSLDQRMGQYQGKTGHQDQSTRHPHLSNF